MKDERIQTTANRFAAVGFAIWSVLMSISLLYRTLILKQHPREWWDIFAIFLVGILFVSIAQASKGVLDLGFFKRRWLIIGIIFTAAFIALKFIAGRIHSVVDVGTSLIVFPASLAGMGLTIAIAHFLNRRWKRKEGLEDEE